MEICSESTTTPASPNSHKYFESLYNQDVLVLLFRLPRPEGYSWGKTDSSDPAGCDLLALPLNQPVPFRKNTVNSEV